MSERKAQPREAWEAELKYAARVRPEVDRAFNHDPACFYRYLTMQAQLADEDGQADIAEALLAVAADLTIDAVEAQPGDEALLAELGDGSGVNLDAYNDEGWLKPFAQLALRRPTAVARALFPDRGLAETLPAVRLLRLYATSRALVIRHRLRGRIAVAAAHEERCDLHYSALPDWARTW